MAMVLAASTALMSRRAAQLSGIQNAFHRVQQARKFCAAAGSAGGLSLVFGQTQCSSIPGGIHHLVNLRRQFSWSTSSPVGIPGAVPGTSGRSAERSTGAETASAGSAERSTGGFRLPDTNGAEKRTGLVPHPLLTLIFNWHSRMGCSVLLRLCPHANDGRVRDSASCLRAGLSSPGQTGSAEADTGLGDPGQTPSAEAHVGEASPVQGASAERTADPARGDNFCPCSIHNPFRHLSPVRARSCVCAAYLRRIYLQGNSWQACLAAPCSAAVFMKSAT